MSLFKKKSKDMPKFSTEESEPVLRCSICTGEQVLCARDRASGKIRELMLIRSYSELEEFCDHYGLDPSAVRKIY